MSWPVGQAALLFTNVGKRDTAFAVTFEVTAGMDLDEERRRIVAGTPIGPGKAFAVVLPRTLQKMRSKTADDNWGAAATWKIDWRSKLGVLHTVEDSEIYSAIAPLGDQSPTDGDGPST